MIIRNSTNTSVTLNSIPLIPGYYSSVGVTQYDVIKSPLTNDFEVTNVSSLFDFPRGNLINTLLITSLDQQFLFAASATSTIAKTDISNSNNPSFVASSNLLGPVIDIGVNDQIVAVLSSNNVYDLINEFTNPDCSIQLFDIDSLLLTQTIPLPSKFKPSSISLVNQSLFVVGSQQQQTPLIISINLQTNETSSFNFSNIQLINLTEIVVDSSRTYAYVGTSSGTIWKLRLSDFSVILRRNATSSVRQVLIYHFYYLLLQ